MLKCVPERVASKLGFNAAAICGLMVPAANNVPKTPGAGVLTPIKGVGVLPDVPAEMEERELSAAVASAA